MIRVVFEKEKNRSAAYDGDRQVGQCDFVPAGKVWRIVHTGTDPEYGGQGIAARLVGRVAEAAEKEGVRIDPVCSYAAKWLEKNAPGLQA